MDNELKIGDIVEYNGNYGNGIVTKVRYINSRNNLGGIVLVAVDPVTPLPKDSKFFLTTKANLTKLAEPYKEFKGKRKLYYFK